MIKLKWEIIWTGRLPHLSGLPHLPGDPHLHVNKPLAWKKLKTGIALSSFSFSFSHFRPRDGTPEFLSNVDLRTCMTCTYICMHNLWNDKRQFPWRTSRDLNCANKTYKLKVYYITCSTLDNWGRNIYPQYTPHCYRPYVLKPWLPSVNQIRQNIMSELTQQDGTAKEDGKPSVTIILFEKSSSPRRSGGGAGKGIWIWILHRKKSM